jgi:hypothetical protein
MKSIILLLPILILQSCAAQKIKSELAFTYTPKYCGGVKPNEMMLKENETPKPLPPQKLYVYSGANCVDSISVDAVGKSRVNLKSGTYTLFEAWKHFKTTPNHLPKENFKEDCLIDEWKKPSYDLTFTKKLRTVKTIDVLENKCEWQYPCQKTVHLPNKAKGG